MIPQAKTDIEQVKLPNDFSFEMSFIKGGTFQMGDEHGDLWKACRPVRQVTVPDFHLGVYPVTQALWKAVMGEDHNPASFKGDNRPVESVSWAAIVKGKNEMPAFLDRLNDLTENTRPKGTRYRLPTEAQWEYAARGGIYHTAHPYLYSGSNHLKEVGWYDENSHSETKPIGLKMPNILGIYDMSGNVWEWCEDRWHENYDHAPLNGTARQSGSGDKEDRRVLRGGSWDLDDLICRVAYRGGTFADYRNNDIGFRLSRY